jgi:hypothetical protein
LKKNYFSTHKLPKEQSTSFWSQGILGVNLLLFDLYYCNRIYKWIQVCLDFDVLGGAKQGAFLHIYKKH